MISMNLRQSLPTSDECRLVKSDKHLSVANNFPLHAQFTCSFAIPTAFQVWEISKYCYKKTKNHKLYWDLLHVQLKTPLMDKEEIR